MTYTWTWVSGPDQPALTNSSSSTVSFTPTTYTEPSTRYTLKCAVRDDTGLYAEKSTFEVKAGNRPSTVTLTASKRFTDDSDNVYGIGDDPLTISMSNLTDIDNDIVTKTWVQPLNTTLIPAGDGNSATLTTNTAGNHMVSFTAIDGIGLTRTTNIVIATGTRPVLTREITGPSGDPQINRYGTLTAEAGGTQSFKIRATTSGSTISTLTCSYISGPGDPGIALGGLSGVATDRNRLVYGIYPTYSAYPTHANYNPYTLKAQTKDALGLANELDVLVLAGSHPYWNTIPGNGYIFGTPGQALALTGGVATDTNNDLDSTLYSIVSGPDSPVISNPGNLSTASFVPTRGLYTLNAAAADKLDLNYSQTFYASTQKTALLLHGGSDNTGMAPDHYGDTWSFNGTVWAQLNPANSPYWEGSVPTYYARNRSACAYDSYRDEYVVYGGYSNNGAWLTDTWKYSGGNWTKLNPATVPNVPSASMTFDTHRNKIVMVGLNVTFEWDGVNWTNKNVIPPFQLVGNFIISYNEFRERSIMLKVNPSNQLEYWEYDGTSWAISNIADPSIGPRLYAASLAYDPIRGTVVVFGGRDYVNPNTFVNQTWELDNGLTWTQKLPASSPAPGVEHSMAFCGGINKIVLFGGVWQNGTMLYDTWTWNGTNWTDLGSYGPAARYGAALM